MSRLKKRPDRGAPTQDMVLGCYYLTTDVPARDADGNLPAPRRFGDDDGALLAYELTQGGMTAGSRRLAADGADGEEERHRPVHLRLHEPIEVTTKTWDPVSEQLVDTRLVTTVGRIIFNQVLPEPLRFANKEFKRSDLRVARGLVLPAARPDRDRPPGGRRQAHRFRVRDPGGMPSPSPTSRSPRTSRRC